MRSPSPAPSSGAPPLVAHLIYRFAIGGTENGMVNLFNGLPRGRFRHLVIALQDVDVPFTRRITAPDVEFMALHKPGGHGYRMYPRLYRLFRERRPAIVHTRNLAALEAMLPAWAAGVPVRIHGEHGWDMTDPGGQNRAFRWVRRVYRPFVTRYVAVSRTLVDYLGEVGVPGSRIEQIYNGVDASKYRPAGGERPAIPWCPFTAGNEWLVGTVGRMQPVKDSLNLVRAFLRALELSPAARPRLRLVMVGDGPLRAEAAAMLERAGASPLAWLPGERNDIDAVMRGLDCFVLPSLAEGISNTILEAMASGLPVIATDVGGNPELVAAGVTGQLVPPADPDRLARAILDLAADPDRAITLGRAGRARVEREFSLNAMVRRYLALYEQGLREFANPARQGRAA